MNFIGVLTIGLGILVSPWVGPGRPTVGKCPLKGGQVEIVYLKGPAFGDIGFRSIQIIGKDSLVRSVSSGEIQAVMNVGDLQAVMVRSGPFFYIYSNLDSCALKKGQYVTEGDTLGFCGQLPLDFAISDRKDRGYDMLWRLVECPSKLVNYRFRVGELDTTLEGRALDKLFKIREVQVADRRIDSFSHHQHGVSLIVDHRPTQKEPYFIILAGYSGSELRYETYFTFYVYAKGLVVKVADPETGVLINLAEWRKKEG